MISAVASNLPSSVFTVTVALPFAFASTLPSLSTAATDASELLHVTFLFVASSGLTFAVSLPFAPISRLRDVGASSTPLTAPSTETTLSATNPPSSLFAAIIATPFLWPRTIPVRLTVATDASEVLHATFLFSASAGSTVASNFTVSPVFTLASSGSMRTLLTDLSATTWSAQRAVNPPSVVSASMFATPRATAVTSPVDDTVATAASELLHVTLLSVAFDGCTVATS